MKWMYITDSIVPSKTANSVHVMNMCGALKQTGVDISLVIPGFENHDGDGGAIFSYYGIEDSFNIIRLPFKREVGKSFFYAWRALSYAKKEKADMVYIRMPQAIFWAIIYRIPFVVELHQTPRIFRNALSIKLAKKSSLLRFFVTITYALKSWYIKWGMPNEKMHVFPDAVKIERFGDTNFVLPVSGKKKNILYCGSLYEGRGINTIIAIAQNLSDYDFMIVGGGESEVHQWKYVCEEKNVRNIQFKGHVSHKDIPQWLSFADILLMPFENVVRVYGNTGDTSAYMSPMKMFEYMASGKPIIASDLPALREVLTHRQNAYLVDASNVELWVKTIQYIFAHPEEAQHVAVSARSEVEEKYTWKKRANDIVHLVKQCA